MFKFIIPNPKNQRETRTHLVQLVDEVARVGTRMVHPGCKQRKSDVVNIGPILQLLPSGLLALGFSRTDEGQHANLTGGNKPSVTDIIHRQTEDYYYVTEGLGFSLLAYTGSLVYTTDWRVTVPCIHYETPKNIPQPLIFLPPEIRLINEITTEI